MDIEEGVVRLYALKTPVKLQVIYVAWHKNHCIIRLVDRNSMSPIIFVQTVLDELIIGDTLVITKVRWSNKNDMVAVKAKLGPLLDNDFAYLIIANYHISIRESEIGNIFDNRPFNYLQSLQIIKTSMNQFNCQQFGSYPAFVKHIDTCLEAEEKNSEAGSALRQKGNKEFETKNYEEAIKFYEKAKRLLNYDATIWSNSSLAYQRIGENEKSLLDALVALKLDPFSVKAYHRAGFAMKNLKQYDQAIRFVRAGIYLCGALTDFTSFFESIKNDIADVIKSTTLLSLNLKTVLAIVEQATLETKYMRKNMFALVESLGTMDSVGTDVKDCPRSAKSLTELLTEVCTTESANSWYLRHPNAFAEFMEELFIEKLPPGVKKIQKLVKEANRLFFTKSYAEAMLKYTEIAEAKSHSICKSELCVLKYLSSLCNVMLVYKDGFDEDFRTTFWITRLLQEWLYTHCMVILGDPTKNSRQIKKNCTQCILCRLNDNLTEIQAVDMLLRTVPLHYLNEVCSVTRGEANQLAQIRKKQGNMSVIEKDDLIEFMRLKESACSCFAEDNASTTTENSYAASDKVNPTSRPNNNSTENTKGKNKAKQNNKKKAQVVKKSKNTKGKKNKKKGKKNSNSNQQKQCNVKKRNKDDSDKESNSYSSSDMADDENENDIEYEMFSGDNISLGYNPRRDADMNNSPDRLGENNTVTESQMEILYEFMADWMNAKGPMRNDDPRLVNYMSDNFPENALSYLKSRSVEDFLVMSGRFVALDSIICVKGKANDAKNVAAASICNTLKNSKFFISDNLPIIKSRKMSYYIDFIKDKCTVEPSLAPKKLEKIITNGDPIKKLKSSTMDLDDFEDDVNSISLLSNSTKSVGSPAGSYGILPSRNTSTITTISKIGYEKESMHNLTVLSDDFSSILNSSVDINNSNKNLSDMSNLRQMSELNEKLLKAQKDFQAKVEELNNTRKEYNELYSKLHIVTEEFNKFKLQQRFELKQLEEDKLDLRKLLENEKGNQGTVKIANETIIKNLHSQLDVLTFKYERSNNEMKDKNTLVDHGTRMQTELLKRLKKADLSYVTLKRDIYDYICNRELNRLENEIKALNIMPSGSLTPKILTDALLLWPKVKLHISSLLQQEQKKIHNSFDSLNTEKYNPIEYDGITNLNIPDAHLALLFEQQNIMKDQRVSHVSIHIPTSTHVATPTKDSASPSRSPFTAEISIPQSFAADVPPFSSTTVVAGLDNTSTVNRNAFSFESGGSMAAHLQAFAEPSFTQQATGQLRDKIKEIWGNKHSKNMPSKSAFASTEIPNPIVRPVPQLGTYHQAGFYNRNSPIDSLQNDSYIKLIDAYTEKYRATHTRDDITKALVQIREKNGGRLSGLSKETIFSCMSELLTVKRNVWAVESESKIRDIWNTEDDICSICLNNLSVGQKVDLTCHHSFHKNCLIPWTKKNSNCPTCRKVCVTANL